ncbi:gas vesicle accessory protein GvpU [Neobacillus cucumis]|nr:gas vesicle accessory protein GvpU [Neobacillus cucumis]
MRDVFLQSLVFLANNPETKLEMGITLNLAGSIVSGTLIGDSTYFELIKEKMNSSLNERESSFMTSVINRLTDEINKNEEDSEDSGLISNFIHLKDAKFYTPGNNNPLITVGALWRGKLADVVGFTFGNLSQ